MRVLCPALRPHIGRRPAREYGPLGARHRFGFALGRGLARAHGGIRHPWRTGGHGGHAAHTRDRDLRCGRLAARRALGGGDREGVGDIRAEALPRSGERGAGEGRTAGRAARRPRLPDRGLEVRSRYPAPADGLKRRPRCGRAMERRGRERRCAESLYRSPGRGPDRLGLPGHRQTGGDVGPHAAHRVRVPLRGRLPHGGPVDAHARGRRDIPLLLRGAGLVAELGAALRRPAPHRHGRGRRAHGRGRAHAGWGDRRLARRPGGDKGRGRRRGGDVGLPLDVGALPRRGPGLRGGQDDQSRDLGALGRTGRGLIGRAGRYDGQHLARQHPAPTRTASHRSRDTNSAPRRTSTRTATRASPQAARPTP